MIVVPVAVCFIAAAIFFALELAARARLAGQPNGFRLAAGTLDLVTSLVVVLFAVVTTCFHVSREFSLGTVRAAWVRPMTRNSWYIGKVISACGAVTGVFLCAAAVIVLLAMWRFGLADLMEKDYLVHSAASLGWRLVLSVALTIWSLWALVSVVAALAVFFCHPGSAIAAALGIGILFTVLDMFSQIAPFVLSTYIGMPIEQMGAMASGVPLPFSWSQVIWRTLAGAGAWMAVAWIIGLCSIRQKEITF